MVQIILYVAFFVLGFALPCIVYAHLTPIVGTLTIDDTSSEEDTIYNFKVDMNLEELPKYACVRLEIESK